jgi:two-component sensor histidine kinase
LYELQHRVNNLWTTIRAVAQRTRARSASLEQFPKSFDDRLAALARIRNLLNRSNGTAIAIYEIVIEELSAQGVVDSENFACHVRMYPFHKGKRRCCSMALHELATTAVKHGALSIADGSIEIGWTIDPGPHGDEVRIRWREHGVQVAGRPAGAATAPKCLGNQFPRCWEGSLIGHFSPTGLTASSRPRFTPLDRTRTTKGPARGRSE